jgi:hypothetical protein
MGALLATGLGAVWVAIAPVPLGQNASPELVRAFQEELPRALADAGFQLRPPNEIDLKVGERPELTRCTAGGCLAEECTFLKVGRLVLPHVEQSGADYTIGLTLYDAGERISVAETVERCPSCTAAEMHVAVRNASTQLAKLANRPGTVEVSGSQGELSIDKVPRGPSPWKGELPAGDHVITLEANGARVQRDITVAPGRTARVEIHLDAVAGIGAPLPPRRFRVAKWVILSMGLVGVAVGGALWGLDGQGTCSLSAGAKQCPKVYDTLPTGATLAGLGGALVVTSLVMFGLDSKRESAR